MGFFVKVDRSGNKGRYYRERAHVPNIFRGMIMCGIARVSEQEFTTFFSMKMMLEALINGQDGNGTLVGGAFAKFSFFNAFFYNRKQGVIERFIAIVERPKACRFFSGGTFYINEIKRQFSFLYDIHHDESVELYGTAIGVRRKLF